jgi:hypothetical protein
MTTAPEPSSVPQRLSTGRWRLPPLFAGACFGLGYGVVQRLMAVEFPRLVQLGQAFEVREFPGTSLEALRLKRGATVQSIRGDLAVLELEEQEQEKARPIEKALEPAPLIRPLPPAQQTFTEPLDAEPDPEPVQPQAALEEAPPELPDQPTP